MRAVEASSDSTEQRNHTPMKLTSLSHFQDLFQLSKKHNLLRTIGHRPILQKPSNDRISELGVFLNELNNAITKLLMIRSGALRPVQRHQSPDQEKLVLLFQRQRETVDYTSQNLEQLRDAVVPLCLENEPVEDVVDGFPYERTMHHELAVYPVEDGFQILSLSPVHGVEELQEL